MSERFILGTAGHIDHGKTSLVRALTSVDCDRLPEEKRRGITIELGFAPLELPSGRRLAIVDVPGHERLVRTMVSGATGIDLVLFVVAADEGIMPQSREHLAICELLGVRQGVVALTKIDAVDAEIAELARLEVEEELAASSLAGAPLVPVSATTGQGLDALRETLDRVVGTAPARTLRDGPSWLPVDRVFSMRGFGTVATGTLRGGAFEEGAPVEVFPDGRAEVSATRIRGLQMHGEPVSRAFPGSRCGLNLQGMDVDAVPRGSVIATPGRLAARPRVGVELGLLEGAPPQKNGTTLTVHLGTAERPARVLLLDRERLEPGERGFAELRFATPLVAVEGDRFILRGFSRVPGAGWTVGGGRVLDTEPARGRRARSQRAADLAILAGDEPAASLAVRLERAGLEGVRERDLLRAVRSIEGIQGIRAGTDLWLHATPFEALSERVVRAVEAHHQGRPLDAWVGFGPVRGALPARIPDDAIRAALRDAAERGLLESHSSGHRSPGFATRARDSELERRFLERITGAGLAPPALSALAREFESDPRALQRLAEHAVRQERIVRVASGLFFDRAAIDELRERLVRYLEAHGEIDPAGYKQLTGQTRKHTVPLMEFFDAEKLTLRRDNLRVLRGRR